MFSSESEYRTSIKPNGVSGLLMDYRTDLIKTQYPVTSTGPNDLRASAEATAGPIGWGASRLSLFSLNWESRRRTRTLREPWFVFHPSLHSSAHATNTCRPHEQIYLQLALQSRQTFMFNQQQHLSARWAITMQSLALQTQNPFIASHDCSLI